MKDGIPGGLQHRHETCCEKGGHRGRRACRVQRWHYHGDVVFRTGGLVYDNIILLILIVRVVKNELYFTLFLILILILIYFELRVRV